MNNSLRPAYVIVVLFTGILSFFTLFSLDSHIPVGPTVQMAVLRPAQDSASFVEINSAVSVYAQTHGIDLVKEATDLDNPGSVVSLTVMSATGNQFAKSWLDNGYPGFNKEVTYQVHDGQQTSATDPGGAYLASGTQADLNGLADVFSKYDYQPTTWGTFTVATFVKILGGFSLWLMPAVVIILVVSLVGIGVATNSRRYAIERLQGYGFGDTLASDASAGGLFCAKVAGVLGSAALLGVWFYNRFSQLFTWLAWWALGLALGLIIVAIAHTMTLLLVWRIPLSEAIRGGSSSQWMNLVTATLRTITLIVFCAVTAVAANDLLTYQNTRHESTFWGGQANLGAISIKGNPNDQQLTPAIGDWLRQLDKDSELLISAEQRGISVGSNNRSLLCVNDNYLTAQNIRDVNGFQVHAPVDARTVLVLVPEDTLSQTQQIIRQVQDRAAFQANPNNPQPETITTQLVAVPNQEQRFTYQAQEEQEQTGNGGGSVVTDPIIMAVSASTQLITDYDLQAYASQSKIMVTNYREVAARVDSDPQLSRYVSGIVPVAQTISDNLSRSSLNLMTSIGNFLISAVILMATTAGLAVAYTRRKGDLILACRISGWTWLDILWVRLLSDFAIATVISVAANHILITIINRTIPPMGYEAPIISLLRTISPLTTALIPILVSGLLAVALIKSGNRVVLARSADVG